MFKFLEELSELLNLKKCLISKTAVRKQLSLLFSPLLSITSFLTNFLLNLISPITNLSPITLKIIALLGNSNVTFIQIHLRKSAGLGSCNAVVLIFFKLLFLNSVMKKYDKTMKIMSVE